MDLTKCRTTSRLKSALLLVEAATGKVLKVWYEPDWDPQTTKVIPPPPPYILTPHKLLNI